MSGRRHTGQRGFTYLILMITVVVTGIALAGAGKYWRTAMKRERETELLFRGDRIRRAIASYVRMGSGRNAYPARLADLVRDPRFPGVRRHLRKVYPDPMTQDGEWGLIRGPGGIRGVFSKSREKPLRSGNFPPEYASFEGAQQYSDWKFVHMSKGAGLQK